MELSDQASYTANHSSEEVEGELMEHGYVVGRKGPTGLIKLSKVFLDKGNICNVRSVEHEQWFLNVNALELNKTFGKNML